MVAEALSAAAHIIASPADPPRKRFTRADVERLQNAGVFEGLRYELIQGDLIDKMGQKPPHAYCIQRLTKVLIALFGVDSVRVQLPLEVGDKDQNWSLPEPDIAVVPVPDTAFAQHFPRGNEATLVVEVSDTTVRHDLNTKRDLYARAGVPEYWVLDVTGRRLVVHRDLAGEVYRSLETFAESESVRALPVASMLPPPIPGAV